MVRAIPSHPHQPLDFTRIAANAGAIAFNGAMLMLMLIPLSAPQLILPKPDTEIPIIWVKKEPPKIDPIKIEDRQIERKPKPTPIAQPIAKPTPQPPIVADNPEPNINDFVAVADTPIAEPVATDVSTPVLQGATLQSLKNPPPSYPPDAVRGNLTGVVELEILVGIDGKPIDVSIVRSSGHRILDQAAVRVVKSRWTFQPAMSNGQPVQARGRVPIEFKLDQ